MNPLMHTESKINTKTTIMWLFRALSIVPTLVFLAGLRGSAVLAIVGFVLLAPLTAVHWTMWFQLKKLKAQRAAMMYRPAMPPYQPMPMRPYPPASSVSASQPVSERLKENDHAQDHHRFTGRCVYGLWP